MKRQDRIDYGATLRIRRVWYADGAEVEPEPENASRPDSSRATGQNIGSLDEAISALADARNEAAQRRVENKQLKDQLSKLEKQMTEVQTQRQQAEDAELTEQNKFRELAEKYQQQVTALQTQLQEQQAQFTRVKVAAEFHLPDVLADRLRGESEEALREDAMRLAELVKPSEPALPDAAHDTTPAQSPPPHDVEHRRHTTAAPGGPPIGRTDADRRAQYFSGAPAQSPMFSDIDVILPPGNEG